MRELPHFHHGPTTSIDWMPLTWTACAGSKMSNGITMYETALFDNRLNGAPSQTPRCSVDCAGSVTCSLCHPKVKYWNYTTSPWAQSAGHDRGLGRPRRRWLDCVTQDLAVIDLPSQRQFISPIIAWRAVLRRVTSTLRWITSKSFNSSKSRP